MDTKLIRMLRKIQDCKDKFGTPNGEFLLRDKEFTHSDLTAAKTLGLIDWSGAEYYVTEKGFHQLITYEHLEALNSLNSAIRKMDDSSTKLNSEMLKHTKTMKTLTYWILGFTIVNIIGMGLQIWLTFRTMN